MNLFSYVVSMLKRAAHCVADNLGKAVAVGVGLVGFGGVARAEGELGTAVTLKPIIDFAATVTNVGAYITIVIAAIAGLVLIAALTWKGLRWCHARLN